jgi:predicted RNA binding protein YcfA (HicA-like mRNA interferase family)
MKSPDLIRLIENDGWSRVRTRGSHRQYTHPSKPGVVTVRRHPTEEVGPGALQGVLQQAQVQP